jgi:hypothetical protein
MTYGLNRKTMKGECTSCGFVFNFGDIKANPFVDFGGFLQQSLAAMKFTPKPIDAEELELEPKVKKNKRKK